MLSIGLLKVAAIATGVDLLNGSISYRLNKWWDTSKRKRNTNKWLKEVK